MLRINRLICFLNRINHALIPINGLIRFCIVLLQHRTEQLVGNTSRRLSCANVFDTHRNTLSVRCQRWTDKSATQPHSNMQRLHALHRTRHPLSPNMHAWKTSSPATYVYGRRTASAHGCPAQAYSRHRKSKMEWSLSTVDGKKFATQTNSNMQRLDALHRMPRVACDNPFPQTFNVEKKAHELALRNLRGSRTPSFQHAAANNIELRGWGGDSLAVERC